MIRNDGELDGVRILSPRTVWLMHTNQVGTLHSTTGLGFGLGFETTDRFGASGLRCVGSYGWGGAYGTTYSIDPETRLTVLMMQQFVPGASDLGGKFQTLVFQALLEQPSDRCLGMRRRFVGVGVSGQAHRRATSEQPQGSPRMRLRAKSRCRPRLCRRGCRWRRVRLVCPAADAAPGDRGQPGGALGFHGCPTRWSGGHDYPDPRRQWARAVGHCRVRIAPVPTVLDSGAPPGTYFVRLVALNGAVASAPSNEIIVVVAGGGGCSPPGVPTGLTATVAGGSVTVRWNASLAGGAPLSFALLVGFGARRTQYRDVRGWSGDHCHVAGAARPVLRRVVATNACGSSAPSNEASFVIGGGGGPLSLPAGVYQGTIANHNRFGLPPITSFTLQLNQAVPAGGLQMISGRWTDNRGCVKTSGIFGGMPAGLPQISVESLACNDGDFGLRVTSVNGNVTAAFCILGGPNCTFQMTRQ